MVFKQGEERRGNLTARLGRLRAEVRRARERLPERGESSPAELPAEVEADMARLITRYSADLLSVHAMDGTYLFVSRNSEAFFGWPAHELVGRSPYEFFHPDDVERVREDHTKHLEGQAEEPKVRYRLRSADGSFHWVETRSRTSDDGRHIVCITRDIDTEVKVEERLRQAERRLSQGLYYRAYTDSLTGLPNRRALQEELVEQVERRQRTGAPLAVVLFDVDRLKPINDELGHATGDRVLEEVGQCLSGLCRRYEMVGRWGGDEFLAVLESCDREGALRFADRVRRAVKDATVPEVDRVTLSSGVAAVEGEAVGDVSALLDSADRALYRDKREGRGRVATGPPEGTA